MTTIEIVMIKCLRVIYTELSIGGTGILVSLPSQKLRFSNTLNLLETLCWQVPVRKQSGNNTYIIIYFYFLFL